MDGVARAPLLFPTLAFLAAVAAAPLGPAWAACILAFAACAITFARTRALGAFACAGLATVVLHGAPAEIGRETRTLRLTATVVGDVRSGNDVAETVLALADGTRVQATLRERVDPGERLLVRGRLVPFDEARNPGEPSRRAIARGEGLAGELTAAHLLARGAPDPFDARTWAPRLRAVLSARLRARLHEPEATIVAGALWGERGTLPHDVRDDFQATGTVHVLVTAGLHLGVVAAIVGVLLRLCAVPRVAASLATIPCVVAYAWLSGAHLPSQRAAVMVSVALLARASGARLVSWNALALAALIVAILWPAAVTTVSFALSFSCVSAIVLFARPLEHAFARIAAPARVREALSLTVSTQIGVWPLSAATFGLVAPYAVLANAVVVPATALAIVGGIATLALAQVPFLAGMAANATQLDVAAILAVVHAVAALPGARVSVAPPPWAALVAYDLAVLVAARLLRDRAGIGIALLATASAAVLATTLRLPDGTLRITMLDVGQGDGIVIRTPRGHTILIDSGGRLERGSGEGGVSPAELVGERVVLAYLRREGVRRVDLLVNTHPHGDHVGGCFPIVQALRVDAIADSGQSYGGRAFRDCIAAAQRGHVPIHVVRAGMRYATDDGVLLEGLAPEDPLFSGANDVNENSIVLRLTYDCPACVRPFRMLFTGDAGAQTEARLLEHNVDLAADALKVGHHGSAYSSTPAFLAAVHARDALISVGRHNLFGHPAPSTVAHLEVAGATIFRTDRCGAILLVVERAPHVDTTVRCRTSSQ